MTRKKLLVGLKVAVSLGLLGWLGHTIAAREGVDALLGRASAMDHGWLLAAVALHFATVLLGVTRWRMLLGARGISLPFGTLLRSFLGGRFVGAFTPSTTGLDGYRALDVAKRTGEPAASAAAIVVEKLVGLIGMATVCAMLVPFGALDALGAGALGVAAAMALVAACGLFVLSSPTRARALTRLAPKRVRSMAERIASAASGGGLDLRTLALCVGLGVLSHLAISSVFATTGLALGVDASIGTLLGVGNAITLAVLLPISVGGVGVREGVAVTLLAGAGVPAADALLLATLGWVTGQAPAILGGLLMLLPARQERAPALDAESSVA